MKQNKKIQVQAYRSPRIFLKDLLLSVVTLGVKKPRMTHEEAKTFSLVFNQEKVKIIEETIQGESVVVIETELNPDDDLEIILSKGKFKHKNYVYHLDKETIETVG